MAGGASGIVLAIIIWSREISQLSEWHNNRIAGSDDPAKSASVVQNPLASGSLSWWWCDGHKHFQNNSEKLEMGGQSIGR